MCAVPWPRVQQLHACPVVSPLRSAVQICPLLRTEMLVAGTVVVREGDVARNLFFLIDGKVRPSPRGLHAAAPRCGRQRCAVSSPCQPVRPRAKSRRVQIQCLRNDIRNLGDLYPISVLGEDLLCANNGETRSRPSETRRPPSPSKSRRSMGCVMLWTRCAHEV